MAFPFLLGFFFFLFPSLSFSFELPLCDPHDYSLLHQFSNSFSLNHDASISCDDEFFDGSKYQFKNLSYPRTSSWGNISNCCLWDGVTCDSMSGHVIGLDLSCSWLQGQLHPNNTLFQLSHLQTLNLAYNDFSGSLIPSQFGDLPTLTHLNLSQSAFVGKIPPKISQLSKLVSLDLSGYVFGPLDLRLEPSTWEKLILNITELRELVLDSINMSSITPSSLSFLMNFSSSLVSLSLRHTQLQGQVLDSIGQLKSLNFLLLSYCQFNGYIPSSFKNLTQLTYLDLASNNFSGELTFLSNLTQLTHLNLHFNNFSGELSFLSNLTQLTHLILYFNNFSGELSFLSNLTQLTHLDLGFNNFSGELSFLSNLQSLTSLYLDGNYFSGKIPSLLSNLEHLTILYLSRNYFSGEIPNMFGNLRKLEHLSLEQNNIGGQLPWSLCNLTQLTLLNCGFNKLVFQNGCQFPNLERLYFPNNNLQGNFPESIFGLVNLSSLNLSSNNLTGPINFPMFSNLQNMQELDLSNNKFLSLSFNNRDVNNMTSFPTVSMKNLMFLDLSFNMLQGNLPIPLYDVEYFLVSNNKLSGDIPSLFCNASSLVILDLSHNNLSSFIPKCLVAFPSLVTLDLQKNNFVGTIPNNFSKSHSLQSLHLNNNQFEGLLPLSLAHCNQLQILDVGTNKIDDSFPNWLDGLPELQVLILRENKFHGAIHSFNTEHHFPMLRIFDVSNNHFNGSLPAAYIKEFKGMMQTNSVLPGLSYMQTNANFYEKSVMVVKGYEVELVRIITTFTTIDLSNNMFDGEIPKEIGELHALIGLNLSHNRITGSIPQSIANLTSLEWLDLSANELKGEIPLAVTNLNFLEVLNLSQNQLVGAIPSGKQFDTFSNDSYKGNLGLCGLPLSKECNQDEGRLPQPSLSTEDRFGFGWKPVALGYGCGMVFGMFMGQIVFSTGKPQWLVVIFKVVPKKQTKKTW